MSLARELGLVMVSLAIVSCGNNSASDSTSECMQQCEAKGESALLCTAWCAGSDGGKGNVEPIVYDELAGGQPGTFRIEFEHDAAPRSAIVYVPQSYEPAGEAALVLNFHGFGGRAEEHIGTADMRSLADRDGFVLIYPQGTLLDGSPHWNAALDTPDNKSDADDLGFVRGLLTQVGMNHPFDSERVYAVGYSNGGMMAFALACYASDVVAAVGAVSAQLLDNTTCEPGHPTGVITLHGTDDSVLPYHGGDEGLSAQAALDFWVGYNQTVSTPTVSSFESGGMMIERYVYADGLNDVSVEHYRYVGGDHVWFEEEYEGSDASALVWNFVAGHDINGAR